MIRGWVLGILLTGLQGQDFAVSPLPARQGQTLHVRGNAAMRSVRMNGRTVRAFPDANGSTLALMPVPALDAPGEYFLEFHDQQDKLLGRVSVPVQKANFPVQNVVLSRELASLKPVPGEAETVAAFRNALTETRYWAEPLAAPVPGCVTSPFGVQRLHNGKSTGNYHTGLDQRGPEGEPVRAVAGGVVRIVRPFALHGNTVGVDHGQGLGSLYLHLSRFAVTEGATVKQGDAVGYVGSTGRSTAPHLHWNLYAHAVPVDPTQWISVRPCAPVNGAKRAKKPGRPIPRQ